MTDSTATAQKPKIHPADEVVPTHEVFELQFKCKLAVDEAQESEAKRTLLEAIDKESMSYFYKDCCSLLGWPVDSTLIEKWDAINTAKLEQVDLELAKAKEQYGDVEIKDARLERAHHFCRIGDWSKAMEAYEEILGEKAIESGGKVDIFLTFIRIGLFTDNADLVRTNLQRATLQVESGGDWERRNRLRVYKGVHLAKNERKFEEASELFLSGIATFTAAELLTFKHFVQEAVLLSMCSLSRPTLKSKVASSPEVLQIFAEDEGLAKFFTSFMTCDYRSFFSHFADACEKIRRDRYLCRHYRYFVRNMRFIAYRQYLESYKSVTLPAMAEAFGVSEEFIEKYDVISLTYDSKIMCSEIVSFISSGKLHCKVDRIAGTIESNSSDKRQDLYLEVVKSGDALINHIQMLSRVIDL